MTLDDFMDRFGGRQSGLRATLPRIETARLTLRAACVRDYRAWVEIFGEDDAEATGIDATGSAWTAFCRFVNGWSDCGQGLWAVERRIDRAVVGFVQVGRDGEELGWLFTAQGMGRGYAEEATDAALEHVAGLSARGIDPEMIPALRLAERLSAWRDRAGLFVNGKAA